VIESLKPYPAYKESGQEWLGKVPAHWDLKPGQAAYQKHKVSNTGLKENTVLSLSYGRIKVKATDKQHGLVPESYETYQIVNEGNIIIRGTDLQNDHTSLRIGLARNHGIISSAYLCLETRAAVSPDYGYQILNAFDLTKAIYRYGSGLRQNLDHGEIKRLPIFLPPPDEQAAIVRFLDHANAKIDRFIRAKKKELVLTSELLLTVTQHAMRLPGARNLRFSTVAEVMTRSIERHAGKSYTPIGLFNRGRGIFHKTIRDSSELGDSYFFRVEDGDLVLSGQFAWEGAVAIARARDSGCVASHRYPIMRGRKEYASSAVLLAILRTPYGSMMLDHNSRGAAGRNRPLNAGMLLKEKLPIPPHSAHARITDLLDQEYAIAQSLSQTIKYINEYRTRLTADIVTGKLDVREAAAHLPALTAEPTPEAATTDQLEETESEEIEA